MNVRDLNRRHLKARQIERKLEMRGFCEFIGSGIHLPGGGGANPLQPTVDFDATRGDAPGAKGLSINTGTANKLVDWEGVLRTAKAGEFRMNGLRRVQNWAFGDFNNNSGGHWQVSFGTATIATGVADPNGGTGAYTITATGGGNPSIALVTTINGFNLSGVSNSFVASVWMRRRTGTGTITFGTTGNSINPVLTTSWQRFAVSSSSTSTQGNISINIQTNGDAIDVWQPQLENTTGQSNQNPSEFVSLGVLSSPYQGYGVDGVQYFATQNGNTVASNVVTAGTGAAITDPGNTSAASIMLLDEAAATNYFKASDTPATHTTSANLPVGTYTLWMDGTGSIAVSAGTATITGAGTASSGTNVTFQVTVTGTVTFTVTGSPTRAQCENSTARTSYITVTGTTPTGRSADVIKDTINAAYSLQGWVAIKLQRIVTPLNNQPTIGGQSGGNPANSTGGTGLQMWDGSSQVLAGVSSAAPGAINRIASTWGGSTKNISGDGSVGGGGSFDGDMNLGTTLTLGSTTSFGIKQYKRGTAKLLDAQLASII